MAARPASFTAASDSAVKDSIARARQDSVNRTLPGYIVDSILPIEETLRRFRQAVGGEAVLALHQGSESRDALVYRFMSALQTGDSAEFRAMGVSAREFADLIFPESRSMHPPYQQDPALAWRMIQDPSASGYTRLIRRLAGKPIKLVRYHCDAAPTREGANVFWSACLLDVRLPEGTVATHRLFGTIIERDRHFKFMSYRNEF